MNQKIRKNRIFYCGREVAAITIWSDKTGWKVKVAQLCLTLWPHGLQPARRLCPWDSPGKNTAVGCHALLQGNLPKLGIEARSPALQAASLPSEPPGKPTVGQYPTLKRRDILTPATMRMNLEDTGLSDISQCQRTNTAWPHSYEGPSVVRFIDRKSSGGREK